MSKTELVKEPGKKAKSNILVILKPYKGFIFMLIIFTLLGNAVNLILPKIISHGIDSYSQGRFSYKSVIFWFITASLVIFVFTYLQNIFQVYVSERAARDIRAKLSDKISRQSNGYILQANPSRLLTNLTSDIDSVKMFVSHAVSSIFSSVFIIIGACILLLSINWKLALTVIAIIPIIGGAFFIIFAKVRVLFRRSREIIDWLNKVINESIMGAAIIRVVNSQQPEYDKFLAANTDAKNNGLAILRLFATLVPIITFTANMAMLTILALGGHFVIGGSLSLGEFAAFNSYVTILIFPILIIGFMSSIIGQASASYGRISEVLNAPETVETGTFSGDIGGNIEINDVTVMYGDKPALKKISVSLKAHTQIAIIGPTAAGKSQLLYLLAGLIKPNSGTIEFEGRNIHEFDRESFYRQVGFVFQDSVLFNMSLRENIAFNNTVTDDLLQKAIETAELKEFVESLPLKLDTIVSERGTSLSGGQKQRIMLARALAINPKILLLDDFTARVDKTTESKILCNLTNNYPEITLITVTQKISSVKHFDQIVVLMEGEIIAIGKHKELKGTCPEYVQIYNSQRSTSHYELQPE